jgi:membrane dipeptidase
MRTVPVLDLHADTPLLMARGYDFLRRHAPPLPAGALFGHLDLPRAREAGLAGQLFGLVTLPVLDRVKMRAALRQVEAVEETARRSGGTVRLVAQAQEVRSAHAAGVFAAMLSLEGIHAVDAARDRPGHGSVVEALLALLARGVRSVGLVHFTRNRAGCPGLLHGEDAGGLTSLGLEVVDALQGAGCLVDLAHLGDRGVNDVVARTRAPLVVSHCGLRAFRDTARNVPDQTIRAVAGTGGVVGIMYSRTFLGSADVERVVEEVRHLVQVGGEDVAALGSDFDGWVVPPRGLRDVLALPALVARLWDALGEKATRKVLGENALRVLEASPLRAGPWAAA